MTTQITNGYDLVTSDKDFAIIMAGMHNIHINKINLIETMLNKMNWPPGDCTTVNGQNCASYNLLVDIPYGMAIVYLSGKTKGKPQQYLLYGIYSGKTALKNFEKDIAQINPITFDIDGNLIGNAPKTKNSRFNKALSDIIAKVPETVANHRETYSESY